LAFAELAGGNDGFFYQVCLKIILMPKRAELHKRIEARFLSMLENGFLEEVKTLKIFWIT
jgi:tRNA dimethylallyltransferase